MAVNKHQKQPHNKKKKKSKKFFIILAIEILTILLLFGAYRLYILWPDKQKEITNDLKEAIGENGTSLSPKELAARAEQEKLRQENKERQNLIAQADKMTLGYDYDGAIELIKGYQGSQGGYKVYTVLSTAVDRLVKEKEALVLYGNSYSSVTEINQLFFHTLIADTSLAFDGDGDTKGYNMYMITISEFEKILQILYDKGYVLVSMSDLTKKVTLEDGTTKYTANDIYLREGQKPFVLSEDDVSYYKYMQGDGFASRLIVGEDGKPTCEMVLSNGTISTGAFDIVPILDAFIEEHPDFSYQGAKGLLNLTGYEGILGYRTNDPDSPTYEADVEAAKKVVQVLKAEGWEIGSHSWGHKNMQVESLGVLKTDTARWLKEVGPLVGPTDIYTFPFGDDIETTSGTYRSDKYQFLKDSGFNVFLGVYKEPWMHVKKDYVRMTRRPIDGQALIEFPERLQDLFNATEVIDPQRPEKDW